MRAIVVDGERLEYNEVDDPSPAPGEVLIENRATALNRADLLQRRGGYAPPPGASPYLGLECAGVVTAVGEGVTSHAVGDQVCALLAGGGYAELVAVPAGQVTAMPRGLSFIEAAALPEVMATAYLNLFIEAELALGERALIHAGASGVGTAAIQLCREFGSPCYVTAGSDAKIEACVALGADGGLNRKVVSFAEPGASERVHEWTDGAGIDVILDPVGGAYLGENLKSLNTDGRLVVIGLMGGITSEVQLGLMMAKRLRIIASTLRSRTVAAKAEIMTALARRVWPLVAAGKIKPIIEAVYPIAEAAAAHDLMAGDETIGKIILEI